MNSEKIIYVVSPSGAVGGGMGRVKDYILQSGGDRAGRYRFEALVTRDERGVGFSMVLMLLAVLKIWGAALTGRLALVHVNFGDRGSALRKAVIVLAARLVGAKTVLHLHTGALAAVYARAGVVARYLMRLPFRAASSIIVLGKLWRDWLVEDLGIDGGKIDVVYNGVPIEPVARDFSVLSDAPRKVLFLGLLHEQKGVSDLLAALALLPAEMPGWQAVIAGNGDIGFYEARAQALGLASHVSFPGWVDQESVRAHLRTSDVLVLPSYNEALPLVILEALGAGTPVISTPAGALPEVLSDGETVLFVEAGDPAGLARALKTVLGDDALRQKLAEAGQAAFRARFSLPVFIENLFTIYRTRYGVDVTAGAADSRTRSLA
jgi:glycosyltransferase involved in cell wall biosynthesis